MILNVQPGTKETRELGWPSQSRPKSNLEPLGKIERALYLIPGSEKLVETNPERLAENVYNKHTILFSFCTK